MFSIAVCLIGLWWTVVELPKAKADSDPAGVLALLPSLVGVVLGGWGAWAGIRALQDQQTAPAIAEKLAGRVAETEGEQYQQLLGSGRAAPDGRIDLPFAATGTGGSRADGTLEGIADYYRALRPGRVVITGTPSTNPGGQSSGDAGTGKTVLALSLILGLARERSPLDPVPVRLTAASWPGTEVRDWLRTHLTDVYRLSRREAARLVAANLVLPVVDGLDEMDPGSAPGYGSRAAALLACVNRFGHGGAHCPVVVTCRHAHYQALVEEEAEPGIWAHIAVARVDASRARSYLSQRVANRERSRARWQPVLSALDTVAAGPADTVPPEYTLLADALDTPWRLTLAATVFQERAADGRYLRDPAQLLALAANGQLYEYLLDHYIGAAVAASHRGAADTSRPSSSDSPPRLDAATTWRCLAFLARYLNDNGGPGGGSPRRVAGRALSSTDLVLHELWPLGGKHRTRLTEGVLAVAAPLALVSLAWQVAWPWLYFPVLALLYRPAWPKPRRIDLGRLRTLAGRRALTLGATVGSAIAFLISFGLVYAKGGLHGNLKDPLVFCLAVGLATGLPIGLARGLMIKHERVGVLPRRLIRMDLTAALVFGPVTGIGAPLVFGLVGFLVHAATDGLDSSRFEVLLMSLAGLVIGIFIFAIPAAGGSAALRYFAFLLHTRRKLPWRLGRFLDACYELGILRLSGTAWQFRHRELQDHLATRAMPSSPSP
ncbi:MULTISPECIES: NACHT domain-containing protein [Streptomycetaceae]|uniref:NACHT domain-containing protein n=1 Tax=Streptomycetaceae TaxID=2062 RepID=UPI001161184B|nr:NACHT domain-containing protein [Streptomyces sp. CB02056]